MNFTPNNPQKPPYVMQKPPTPPQKPPVAYTPRDTLFAYLCIPVCFLFVKSSPLSSSALGTMLAFLVSVAFVLTYLLLSGIRPTLTAYITGGVMLTLSAGLLTNANSGLRAFLSLVLMVILAIFVHTCCKKDLFEHFSESPVRRLINGVILLPLNSLMANLVVFVPQKNGKKSHLLPILGWCAVGLVGAVIPTVVIAALLSYDEQFTNLLDRIFSFEPDKLFENIGDVIVAGLLAVCLFAVLFGNLATTKADKKEEETETDKPSRLQVLPKPLVAAFVTPILLLYVLFFVSQWSYYVSAFTHVLPEGLTYAQYAREGFFQLCIVCVFNAILLVCLQAFMRRAPEEKGILRRILAGIISLFTLILIATALSKMVLYIDAYGMTRNRILATWMILLLAVIFILSLIQVFCKKFPIAMAILVTCVVFALVLFLPNIDGMIANYNVDAYLSGDLSSVDVDALCDLDYAAVPALERLEEHLLDEEKLDEKTAILLEQTTARLSTLAERSEKNPAGFFDWNIPTWRAKQMLAERGWEEEGITLTE